MPLETPDLFVTEALPFIWQPGNDGQPFHVSANDPGGATSWGVTYQTWVAWQQAHGETATLGAFKALPRQAFEPLLRAWFWNACSAGSLGAFGIALFDAAIVGGVGHSARFLQTVLGVTVDGAMGPLTLRAAQQTDQRSLARAFTAQREEYYAALPTARYFARGWDRRAEECRDLVLSLLGVPRTVLLSDALNAAELARVGGDENGV